jgi:carbon storage regulator
MLVLTRRVGQQIRIGTSIVVTLLKVESNRARIGVEAPRDVPVFRQELFDFIRESSAGQPSESSIRPGATRSARSGRCADRSSTESLWRGVAV